MQEPIISYGKDTLLVINRGEIALRILRTAKALGLYTVAVYTPSDAQAPHVLLANDAIPLTLPPEDTSNESLAYISVDNIISLMRRYNAEHAQHAITLVHPGYGFLSENAEFASKIINDTGATWLGPKPQVISEMGLKHAARQIASRAGVPIVPGSDGLLIHESITEILDVARKVGFPIILKATAGGGGMGMVICYNEEELVQKIQKASERAKVLFNDPGIFLERYLPRARHIEIQVFGNGLGDVVHMAERECSIQRRHQKIIEETPSPFLQVHPGLREKMCAAAISLCRMIKYGSAGTIEFIVNDSSGEFFFLEMNTRIQVEHPITEEIHPGLDIVKLMIQQGILERESGHGGFPSMAPQMQQSTYDECRRRGAEDNLKYAMEARIYAENPAENFVPCPGLLQQVEWGSGNAQWLRVENWVTTGTTITPFFDPLLSKLIVRGSTREEARERLILVLKKCKVSGPPNNIEYLIAILEDEAFRAGTTITAFLSNFKFIPRALKVVSPGIDMTIQDLPGRTVGLGIPRSGPIDFLAFTIGNILVGNSETTEGIEMILVPGMPSTVIQFYCNSIIAITGKEVKVKVNGNPVVMWSRVIIPEGGRLELEAHSSFAAGSTGFRVYLSVRGGFPGVPEYLGSKSTSMGLGGYQGRALLSGDQLQLKECAQILTEEFATDPSYVELPKVLVPKYCSEWIIYVLPGPHDDEEYLTLNGLQKFYSTRWLVSASSNRLGIRLESPDNTKIEWARDNGGEGGSHPTNILDTGYAPGTINYNGDTPVILTNDAPDMGGYLCLCTVASAEMWKLGQLNPGCTVQFRRITWETALQLRSQISAYYARVKDVVSGMLSISDIASEQNLHSERLDDHPGSSILHIRTQEGGEASQVIYRQAGDSAILVEFGKMELDLVIRARIHAFQTAIYQNKTPGLLFLCPCIRSIMCHFDATKISQKEILYVLIRIESSLPNSVLNMTFSGRRLTFPIVLDDPWNREALQRYIRTVRNKAVYLPSNIEYLANNNGLNGNVNEALQKLVKSDWLVLGVGFYLGCPFLVPIDPRCRLQGQKMNPSRTYTPRGAIGIAGPVAAIYPVESPGGYQLYGRTLPTWQTWGKGKDFRPDRPWLLQPFDQIHFEIIDEKEYSKLEKDFDAGIYSFKIEEVTFSMSEHTKFLESINDEITHFRQKQSEAKAKLAVQESELLNEWERERQTSNNNSESVSIVDDEDANIGSTFVTTALYATVWKIKCKPGDRVKAPDDILIILEAMKTEIPIKAGEENVGKEIKGFGKGIKEQAVVRPGDVLIIFKAEGDFIQ